MWDAWHVTKSKMSSSSSPEASTLYNHWTGLVDWIGELDRWTGQVNWIGDWHFLHWNHFCAAQWPLYVDDILQPFWSLLLNLEQITTPAWTVINDDIMLWQQWRSLCLCLCLLMWTTWLEFIVISYTDVGFTLWYLLYQIVATCMYRCIFT